MLTTQDLFMDPYRKVALWTLIVDLLIEDWLPIRIGMAARFHTSGGWLIR